MRNDGKERSAMTERGMIRLSGLLRRYAPRNDGEIGMTGAEVFGVWINKILNTAHSVIKGVCYEKR